MKSIRFSQVPNMKGKKTMPWTDVTAFNAKEELNAKFDLKLAMEEINGSDEVPIRDIWFDWDKHYDT